MIYGMAPLVLYLEGHQILLMILMQIIALGNAISKIIWIYLEEKTQEAL